MMRSSQSWETWEEVFHLEGTAGAQILRPCWKVREKPLCLEGGGRG